MKYFYFTITSLKKFIKVFLYLHNKGFGILELLFFFLHIDILKS